MKMKAYATFDEYLKDQSSRNQVIIRALRRFVKRTQPRLTEAVKWGNGCWIGSKGPVVYVFAAPEYVQFGFFKGSSLRDPRGLLEGEGIRAAHEGPCHFRNRRAGICGASQAGCARALTADGGAAVELGTRDVWKGLTRR